MEWLLELRLEHEAEDSEGVFRFDDPEDVGPCSIDGVGVCGVVLVSFVSFCVVVSICCVAVRKLAGAGGGPYCAGGPYCTGGFLRNLLVTRLCRLFATFFTGVGTSAGNPSSLVGGGLGASHSRGATPHLLRSAWHALLTESG